MIRFLLAFSLVAVAVAAIGLPYLFGKLVPLTIDGQPPSRLTRAQRLLVALRARLIDDAQRAWRFASVQILAVGAVLTGTWSELPAGVRDGLPEPVRHFAPTLFLVAALLARVTKQKASNNG